MKQTMVVRGRPKKKIHDEKERIIYLRLKEKQRRISINHGIENLRQLLKQQGWIYYLSKPDVLKRSVELIDIMEKQIDIFNSEKNLLIMIHIIREKLGNRNEYSRTYHNNS